MTGRKTKTEAAWAWVLKLTGWGTFVIGGVVVPLARFGRVDYGTLAIGTILALGGSADRLLDMLSRSKDDGRSAP
jgi:hypothetical protein